MVTASCRESDGASEGRDPTAHCDRWPHQFTVERVREPGTGHEGDV